MKKVLLSILAILSSLILFILIIFKISVYPNVWLIRLLGDDGLQTGQTAKPFVKGPVEKIENISYEQNDPYNKLDLYYPKNPNKKLPLLIWVHGGGFIGGTKDSIRDYVQVLASSGYVVASIEYSKAPESKYPTPIFELNSATQFLLKSSKYPIDKDQIIFGGDSAGASIAAQTVLANTNEKYAYQAKLPHSINPKIIKGVILASGPYDINKTSFDNKLFSRVVNTYLWAYSGSRNYKENKEFQYVSIQQYITKNYPPTFITAGPFDPLLPHSIDLANTLEKNGNIVETAFYNKSSSSKDAGHEYQFNLKLKESQTTLSSIKSFLQQNTTK